MSKKKNEKRIVEKEQSKLFQLKTVLRGETFRFLIGILVLVVALFMLLTFVSNFITDRFDQSAIESGQWDAARNYGGMLGARLAHYFMTDCFGVASFFIPIFLIQVGMKLMRAYTVRLWKWFLNFAILMIWCSVAFSLVWDTFIPDIKKDMISFPPGGAHGDAVRDYLVKLIGLWGTFILVGTIAILYLTYLTRETITIVRRVLNPRLHKDKTIEEGKDGMSLPNQVDEKEESGDDDSKSSEPSEEEKIEDGEEGKKPFGESTSPTVIELPVSVDDDPCPKTDISPSKQIPVNAPEGEDIALEVKVGEGEASADGKTVEEVRELEPYDPRKSLENYKFPTLDLLQKYDTNDESIDMAEQTANKNRIITVLRNFGVEISSINATVGPTVTLYEITPAQGVRISKIRNLDDDIALSLSALGIRIIAPIPGKGTIGIEVPNKKAQIVSMESILNSLKFQESKYELPIAVGKTITNEVFMVDLAKMPHLLVAGATGQGKSVGLNAIITSLIYKKHPTEMKFVMVDPKKVEFSIYGPLEKYFIAKLPEQEEPIITDVTKVVQTLKSLCVMMDHRYDLLKKAKVRNIKEYNQKFKSRQLNPEEGHDFMPYIVIIIDEFGDLIMTAGKEVELPIARIAQLARAVGMHMVIATQRPTTNIITGTIKANFPARMAFKVASLMDSRVILDRTGAHQLIGRGDMLFLSGMSGSDPVRVQCAFVDTPEVEKITKFIYEQPGYLAPFELPEVTADGDVDAGFGGGNVDASNLDDMFEEAARLIVVHQQGSTSLIQRKFAIGYNRAGRLMDQLERAGIVGPAQGSKPREVLCADELQLDIKLQELRTK